MRACSLALVAVIALTVSPSAAQGEARADREDGTAETPYEAEESGGGGGGPDGAAETNQGGGAPGGPEGEAQIPEFLRRLLGDPDVMRMPGLPKQPQALHIDLVDGEIEGLLSLRSRPAILQALTGGRLLKPKNRPRMTSSHSNRLLTGLCKDSYRVLR